MNDLENIRKILQYGGKHNLAQLLSKSKVNFDMSSNYGSYLFSQLTTAEIYSPIEDYDKLKGLSGDEKDEILNAFLEAYPPKAYEMEICNIEFKLDTSTLSESIPSRHELLADIEAQRSLMISVATGGPRIESVNVEYKDKKTKIDNALLKMNIVNPNPFNDLWEWYGKWSSGDLPTYPSRRQYISELLSPLIQRLKSRVQSQPVEVFSECTGWTKVDRGLYEIRKRLEEAQNEEQFQAVGLLCRETLISLAQQVYTAERYGSTDDITPSKTDAKRMIDSYLAVELSGKTNEVARKHAKASLDFANDLQHKRTANFRQAALCTEATTSVVNLIAIISGRRNP